MKIPSLFYGTTVYLTPLYFPRLPSGWLLLVVPLALGPFYLLGRRTLTEGDEVSAPRDQSCQVHAMVDALV